MLFKTTTKHFALKIFSLMFDATLPTWRLYCPLSNNFLCTVGLVSTPFISLGPLTHCWADSVATVLAEYDLSDLSDLFSCTTKPKRIHPVYKQQGKSENHVHTKPQTHYLCQ